jgi:hypothetical protein
VTGPDLRHTCRPSGWSRAVAAIALWGLSAGFLAVRLVSETRGSAVGIWLATLAMVIYLASYGAGYVWRAGLSTDGVNLYVVPPVGRRRSVPLSSLDRVVIAGKVGVGFGAGSTRLVNLAIPSWALPGLASFCESLGLTVEDRSPFPPPDENYRPPPGWAWDPTKRHGERFWDGDAWTSRVRDKGAESVDAHLPKSVPGNTTP